MKSEGKYHAAKSEGEGGAGSVPCGAVVEYVITSAFARRPWKEMDVCCSACRALICINPRKLDIHKRELMNYIRVQLIMLLKTT